jgi:hypothetical protein
VEAKVPLAQDLLQALQLLPINLYSSIVPHPYFTREIIPAWKSAIHSEEYSYSLLKKHMA